MVSEHQPAKLAAFEGLYETPEGGAAMSLFGIPNSQEKRMEYNVEIPGMLSFLVHGDFNKPVTGLDQFPENEQPPVAIPYFSYHIMIALGTYFIGITLLALFYLYRGTLFEKRWMMWTFVFSVTGPYIANQAGWIAAEVGRQPWIVYGLLRTDEGFSEAVAGSHVLTSIILFAIIYALLFAVWVFILNKKIQHGPDDADLSDLETHQMLNKHKLADA